MNDAGIHKRVRELAGKATEEAKLDAQAAEQGAKLAARFEQVEGDYRSFYDMLDAQNKRLQAAKGRQPDNSSPAIVFAKDYEYRPWGKGKLVARFARLSSSYSEGPRYYTEVDFLGHDYPSQPRFVLNENFGAKVMSETSPEIRKAWRSAWPGMILMPEEYTPDVVEELREQLSAVLPVARETFNELLGHACDPALNPDLAEAAQAYRRDLIPGAW